MRTDTATLVPPRRLGTLLRQARVTAGLELESLAGRTPLTVVDLDDIERGRRLVDDQMLKQLVALYGVEEAGLLPNRAELVIDLDEGRIAIDDADVETGELTGPDAVLARYLALVYHLRDLPVGSPIGLRDIDVDVLATALELTSSDVERRLHELMVDEDAIARDQKRIKRRMLLPLVGVVIAACSSGILLLVADGEQPAERDVATDPAQQSEISMSVGSATIETDLGSGAAVLDAPAVETRIGLPAVEENPEG